jgi:mannose-6-phosphate isomerase-like protein (cupin superfamily)
VAGHRILRAAEAPDYSGGDSSPFRGYGRPLGAAQLSLNVRELAPGATNVPPGQSPTGGHAHGTIEEIYFVLDGEVTVKLDDEIVALGSHDAVLIPPETVRMARNETERPATLLMLSPHLDDPRSDSVWHENFWPET